MRYCQVCGRIDKASLFEEACRNTWSLIKQGLLDQAEEYYSSATDVAEEECCCCGRD